MRRLPPTEGLHPAGLDLASLPTRRLLARLHAGDAEAVRAVTRALPSLSVAAERVAERLAAGGTARRSPGACPGTSPHRRRAPPRATQGARPGRAGRRDQP